jgi:pyruvate dehydrogenase kinase 2/3/4
MMSRPDDIALPESKPNPDDPYTDHNYGNKLRFRAPMERRCVGPPYLASPIVSF